MNYKKKNLIFIGMPAVGKSTVGIVVAKRLGMQFIDTDLLIQEQEGKLLREINCREAMEHYKKIGTVVYLKASYQTIKKRIRNPKKRGVVLREGQSLRDLYDERTPYFEKYADITVCEDGCRIEETIENVLNAVKKRRKKYKRRKKLDKGTLPKLK